MPCTGSLRLHSWAAGHAGSGRYVTIPESSTDFEHCETPLFDDVRDPIALATLRIWAMWGHALVPTLAVLLTSAVVPAINIVRTVWQLLDRSHD